MFHRYTPACVFFGLTSVFLGPVSQNFTEMHTRTHLVPTEPSKSAKVKGSRSIAEALNAGAKRRKGS